LQQELQELAKKRETIEQEMIKIADYLNGCGAGIKGPLVRPDGFPRDDFDVYEVSHMRNRRACLQTDFNTIMKEMEQKLHRLHETYINDDS
jgi:26S proteasome regulatory subunit N4